jgi:hypothetical protein
MPVSRNALALERRQNPDHYATLVLVGLSRVISTMEVHVVGEIDEFDPEIERPTGAKPPNYLVRHWRGELSLPVSYWVNGTLVSLPAGLVDTYIDWDAIPLFAGMMFFVLLIGLFVWQVVGIWRSATRYEREYQEGWGYAAKGVILLVGLATVFELVLSSFSQ